MGGIRLGSGSGTTGFEVKGKPKAKQIPSASTLKGMLEWGERELEKVKEVLRLVPPGMEEYNTLTDRFEKLTSTIEQVRRQLAERGK